MSFEPYRTGQVTDDGWTILPERASTLKLTNVLNALRTGKCREEVTLRLNSVGAHCLRLNSVGAHCLRLNLVGAHCLRLNSVGAHCV